MRPKKINTALVVVSILILSPFIILFATDRLFWLQSRSITTQKWEILLDRIEPYYSVTDTNYDWWNNTITAHIDNAHEFTYTCYKMMTMPARTECTIDFSDSKVRYTRNTFSDAFGALLFSLHKQEIQELVKKHSNTLSTANAEYIFDVHNQLGMKDFFNDLIKIPDFSKAWDACLDSRGRICPDIIYMSMSPKSNQLFHWALEKKGITPEYPW